jgi:Glycosyl hydrolase family 76
MLMRYARAKKLFIPVITLFIACLTLFLAFGAYLNIQLTHKNKMLVEELVGVLHESDLARQKIKEIAQQRGALQQKIKSLVSQIKSASQTKSVQAPAAVDKTKELNDLILRLVRERDLFQAELAALQINEKAAQEESLRLDSKKVILAKANLDKMYQWLKIHQNPRTGLVMSFEGDKDIASWAFTYDQALMIQIFNNFSDYDRAKKLLDFFSDHAKREDGWFLNVYYTSEGSPAEFVRHSGPNIWLGIAILQYTRKTGDRNYLEIAEEIARNIIKLQDSDVDGGIRGGPQMSWYSTEHNLDAYAFFEMLAKVTNKEKYVQAAEKTLGWLARNTYGREDLPVKRGKGDSTIATDTYAWSIAAIGPARLKTLGMDPDKIMEFVEENCEAEVDFIRPGGQTVKIRGFDFAPQRNVARGGVVSSEWTAQMVVSFKIMADYYSKGGKTAKSAAYRDKADNYLAQLGNMIISSPSPSGQGEGCLPYATQDFVDTGHGWRTPKGKYTGSVSGTAYAIFAYYGYNPLELD